VVPLIFLLLNKSNSSIETVKESLVDFLVKDEELINELLDLSKIEVDEIRIEHKLFDDIFMNKYFKMNGYETQFDPNDWSTIIAKKIR
jgi:hypothetical protein